ncbi:TPA: hypothetical protein ACHJ1B_005622, partial [Escherichia coli]
MSAVRETTSFRLISTRRAPLFTAPADAARHKRCLWSVSR